MNYYPIFANVMKEKMPERGLYQGGWPKGAVIHYTAGRDGAQKTILGGIERGLTYWCIQKNGQLFCAHRAPYWGYHAGKSLWQGLKGGMNDDLIGIEINCAGRLNPQKDGTFKTWYGETIPNENVRFTPGKDNQAKGYYEKYTPEQEETLIDTILWLKAQQPDLFSLDLVLGHDSISPGRKTDPGASLSCTIKEFQELIKNRWMEINK